MRNKENKTTTTTTTATTGDSSIQDEEEEAEEEDEKEEEECDQLTSLPSLHLVLGQSAGKLGSLSDEHLLTEPQEPPVGSPSLQKLDELDLSPSMTTTTATSSNEQFSRLDQHRRSFSSPSVNLIPACTEISAAAAAPTSGNEINSPLPVQVPSAGEKIRRRTALGLISLGSAHFRLGGNSVNTGKESKEKERSTTSSWRTWFTSSAHRSSSSSLANQVQPGTGASVAASSSRGGELQQSGSNIISGKSRTTRKFLLRNLRPQTVSVCSFTQSGATGEQLQQQQNQVLKEAVKQATTTESHGRISLAQSASVGQHQQRQESKQHSNHVQKHLKIQSNHLTSHSNPPVTLQVTLERNTQLANKNNPEILNLKSRALQSSQTSSQQDSGYLSQVATTLSSSSSRGTTTQSNSNKLLQQQQVTEELEGYHNREVESCPEKAKHQEETTNVVIVATCEQVGPLSSLSATSISTVYHSINGQYQSGDSKAQEMQSGSSSENEPPYGSTLVDKLVDSQLEWRQIIREANQNSDWSLERDLSELQIKRQEVIHELVQTERHHCLTLALMRQVYLSGLRKLNESRSGNSRSNSSEQAKGSLGTTQSSGKLSGALSLPAALHITSSSSASSLEAASGDLIDLDRLFPALEDLIAAHELFFAHLRLRLVESCQRKSRSSPLGLVGPIGDLLRDQFRLRMPKGEEQQQQVQVRHAAREEGIITSSKQQAITTAQHRTLITNSMQTAATKQQQQVPANGQKLLQAYAKFCGQHYDSSRYYKHLMQTDKGFKQFIEQCSKQNASCRQRGIPECNLLVTQRLTKYPLLIEQLIKTSKDEPDCEEEKLRDALAECKSLLSELNNQLARKESFERLLDIYAHFCPKSFTIYNKQTRFTKHDLLQHKRLRQLIHSDGQIRVWSATRRKLFQVLCLILNDMVVFLQVESNGSSLSPNNSSSSSNNNHNNNSTSAADLAAKSTHHLPPPPVPVLEDMPSLSGSSQLDFAHQLQHYLQPGQCALLNAVAGALHASNTSPSHSTHSLLGLGGSHAPSSHAQPLSYPAASVPHGVAGSSGGAHLLPGQQAGGFGSVRYYFANIDNKSSVISLSKLLVREKAAHDGEPRIYLISSSPRQPEMYELAFVSKRHQVNFVEKLKGAIESHTKSLKEMLELGADTHDLGMMDEYDDEYDEEYDDNEEDEDLYDEDDQLDDADNNEEFNQQRKCYCATLNSKNLERDERSEEDEQSEDDDDEEDDEDEEFETPKAHYNSISGATRNSSEYFEDALSSPANKAGKQEQQQVVESRKLSSESEESISTSAAAAAGGCQKQNSKKLEPFELDIEQEVLLPPPQLDDQELLTYSNDEDESNCCQSSELDEAGSSSILTVNQSNNSNESTRKGPQTSAESGLSERAKDSLDEAAPSKQKLRTGRRRRPQRPRNVSNQSSSSSSSDAAHRQAIELIAAQQAAVSAKKLEHYENEEFDSGRGLDSSSSSESHTSLPGQQQQQQQVAQVTQVASESGKVEVSSAQQQQASSDPAKVAPSCVTAASAQISSGHEASCDSSTVSSGSRSSRGVKQRCSLLPETECKAAAGSKLVKCSSILAKSGCSFMKQRKLSSVSSMSSQLKLISKLKSGLLESGLGASQFQAACSAKCCSCLCLQRPVDQHQRQHLSACASHQSTLSKQVRQQMRRSSFVPEQKLEELRDLQIQLDKDKQEWQAKFDRMQEQLLNERRELDLAREKLKQDQQQVANEREQLYRKLDVLKEKGILLSPSHKVIITSPELRIYPPTTSQLDNHLHYNNHATTRYLSHPSSSTTHQQQQQQQQLHQRPITALNSAHHLQTTFYPDRPHHPSHDSNYHFTQRHFITQTGKVPLHLSENNNSTTNSQQQQQQGRSLFSSTSFNISSKVPLIGSPSSNNSLLTDRFSVQNFSSSSSSSSSTTTTTPSSKLTGNSGFKQQLESQLI